MPTSAERTCPATAARLLDLYFMEHRAKLIDVAAFLDRLDRAADGPDTAGGDDRAAAIAEMVRILADGGANRARRLLELLSDTTTEPIAKATEQGARGVPERR